MDIKSVLTELGYDIKDFGNYWTCQAVYRGGLDSGSLVLYPESNLVLDYPMGERFSIEALIGKTIGIDKEEDVQKFLTQKSCFLTTKTHFNPKIITVKTYDTDLSKLIPDYSYWNKRCISDKTVKLLRGGLCKVEKGAMRGRFVFPVFRKENDKEDIIGFTGRAVKENPIRWLHLGSKSAWCYPTFLNDKVLREKKSIILVEGIGDLLSLFECGIFNVLCNFGIDMSKALLFYILKLDPEKIIISFNNDSQNSNAGNKAAEKLKNRLCNYFSEDKIKVILPQKFKDWNDVIVNGGKQEIVDIFK